MTPAATSTRPPCQRCDARLYYHEQRQPLCRVCASAAGIERICDRGRTRITAADLAAAHELLAQAILYGHPPEVVEKWRQWIALAERSIGNEPAVEAAPRERGGSTR